MTGVVVVTTPEEMPVTETIDLLGRLEPRRRRGAVGGRRQPRAAGAVRPPPGRGGRPPRRRRATLLVDGGRARRAPGRSTRPSVTEARRRVGNRHLERLRAGIPAEPARALRAGAVHQGHRPARRRRWSPRRSPRSWTSSSRWPSATSPVGLDALLASKEMVLVCGSGGVGKTTIAAALGAGRGRRAGRQGARAHRRPGQAARRRARRRRPRQRRDAGARRGLRGGRRRAARRAVGGDARHQGRLGRAHPPPRARRQGPRRGARQPAVPEHHQPLRAQPRLPRDGAAARAPRVGRVRPLVVDTPPSRNALDVLDAPARMRRVLRQPPAALAHRAVPVAAVHRGVEALLPDRRPGARVAVPAGHRRVLRALPVDGEGLRRPRPRGRGAARRPPHDVRRRVHAGGGAGPRGRVPRPRAAARATTTSARSSPTGSLPTALTRRAAATSAKRLGEAAADGALVADVAGARRGRRRPSTSASCGRARRGRRRASTTSPSSRRARPSAGPSWPRWRPRSLDVPSLESDVNDLGGPASALVDHLRGADDADRADSITDGLARRPRPRQHDARPRAGRRTSTG